MGSMADLHLHSTISDGRLTPTELVTLAYRNGVRIMARPTQRAGVVTL